MRPNTAVAQSPSDGLLIAVASNFKPTAEKLVANFDKTHDIHSRLSSASTGALFQQISLGAEFDVFLSADDFHTKKLVANNLAELKNTRGYAIGKLVLLINTSSDKASNDMTVATAKKVTEALLNATKNPSSKLAMANPNLAPYGMAAKETLQFLSLSEKTRDSIVLGNNVALSLQYFRLGYTTAAFSSSSLLTNLELTEHQTVIEIPAAWHSPLLQSATVIKGSKKAELAKKFLDYLGSKQAKQLISANGYDVPQLIEQEAL